MPSVTPHQGCRLWHPNKDAVCGTPLRVPSVAPQQGCYSTKEDLLQCRSTEEETTSSHPKTFHGLGEFGELLVLALAGGPYLMPGGLITCILHRGQLI